MKKIIITLLSILTMSAACVCACNKNDKNTDVRLRDVQKIEQTDGENNGCPECPEDGHCDKNRKHGRRFPEFKFYIDVNEENDGTHRVIQGYFEPRFPSKKAPAPAPLPAPEPEPEVPEPVN